MRARPERQFYFRLAGHLGYTVAELLARISSRELTEWVVYEQMTGHLGGARADLHTGIIAATVANANRGKGGRKAKASDFIPKWDRHQQSADEMWQIAQAMNTHLGGTVREPTE